MVENIITKQKPGGKLKESIHRRRSFFYQIFTNSDAKFPSMLAVFFSFGNMKVSVLFIFFFGTAQESITALFKVKSTHEADMLSFKLWMEAERLRENRLKVCWRNGTMGVGGIESNVIIKNTHICKANIFEDTTKSSDKITDFQVKKHHIKWTYS